SLLEPVDAPATKLVAAAGIERLDVRTLAYREWLRCGPVVDQPRLSPDVSALLQAAMKSASRQGRSKTTSTGLLLALLEGPYGAKAAEFGLSSTTLLQRVGTFHGGGASIHRSLFAGAARRLGSLGRQSAGDDFDIGDAHAEWLYRSALKHEVPTA